MGFLFQRSEFIERIGRAKKEMARRGIDRLIVSSPANHFWLTGYDGWSFYTPQIVVVDGATEEPIWIGRKMDAVGAKFTAFLKPENVVPYPDEYVGSADLHPMQSSRTNSGGVVGTRGPLASRRMTTTTPLNGMRC